ncbi:pseudaminic acid synthase [SAR86 cluster bacterium]|nr:pseudaminic acid synthase [SAR86 cluster bacterium]
MKKNFIEINKRKIGEGYPPYIIAEISANHNGSLENAKKIIKKAKNCKADAVKLQTYTPDTLTINSDKEDFLIKGGLWDSYNLYDLYEEAHTPFEWHKPLFEYAKKIDITIFSTAYDETAVDLLENLGNPAYKIASFEVVDLPLIKYVAKTKKPMIISTGMADLDEITEAFEIAKEHGSGQVALLHCVSGYPTPPDQINLSTISDMKSKFDTVIGLSDHTLGTSVSVASIPLGTSIIEKHICLSRQNDGVDSAFSLEPNELLNLCENTRTSWKAIGKPGYERKKVEKDNIKFRRSIYVTEDIKAGEYFSEKNIKRIRPGYGLPPKYYDDILGKKSRENLERGTALTWDFVEK